MAIASHFDLREDGATEPSPDGPPHNLDVEQALLGALLFEKRTLADLEVDLRPEHFFEPLHGRMFAALKATIEAGLEIDTYFLWEGLKFDRSMIELGGLQYLGDLVDRAPPALNVPNYARIVVDLWSRRELIRIGEDIARRARRGVDGDETFDSARIIEAADAALMELGTGALAGESNLVDSRTAFAGVVERFEREAADGRPKGLMTGLRCFDYRLRGLQPGWLIVIGGRPSLGKTGLALQGMIGASIRNPRDEFAFFALEMTRDELVERMISSFTRTDPHGESIKYQDMTGDKLTPMEFSRIRELEWSIPKNLHIDDSPTLSIDQVERRVWAMKRKHALKAIAIDYLQIMTRPKANGRNDAAVIGEMTARLKRLARKAEIAIILLSQVSRGVESREDKRPNLGDLRESGSIEQDANAVLFPFRPVYYLERAEPAETSKDHEAWITECELVRRRMDVICPKNRGGAIGTDRQEYWAEFDSIRDAPQERS